MTNIIPTNITPRMSSTELNAPIRRHMIAFIENNLSESFRINWGISKATVKRQAMNMFNMMEHPDKLRDIYKKGIDRDDPNDQYSLSFYIVEDILDKFVGSIYDCGDELGRAMTIRTEEAIIAYIMDGGTVNYVDKDYKASVFRLRDYLAECSDKIKVSWFKPYREKIEPENNKVDCDKK